jgi:hypothetical protein
MPEGVSSLGRCLFDASMLPHLASMLRYLVSILASLPASTLASIIEASPMECLNARFDTRFDTRVKA